MLQIVKSSSEYISFRDTIVGLGQETDQNSTFSTGLYSLDQTVPPLAVFGCVSTAPVVLRPPTKVLRSYRGGAGGEHRIQPKER